ncbi:pro-sigmaK processing inhibitor BofA [Paenibacillaceae bacterium]|nr:pro-sigmaK processing inhibitor BofA [Paenibacillaceae bacterium]
MKTLWLTILIVSAFMLFILLIRNRMSWIGVKRFALHLVAVAVVLYVLNYSGWVSGFHIPLNPASLGTVVLLGIPGIVLILGLQWTIL